MGAVNVLDFGSMPNLVVAPRDMAECEDRGSWIMCLKNTKECREEIAQSMPPSNEAGTWWYICRHLRNLYTCLPANCFPAYPRQWQRRLVDRISRFFLPSARFENGKSASRRWEAAAQSARQDGCCSFLP